MAILKSHCDKHRTMSCWRLNQLEQAKQEARISTVLRLAHGSESPRHQDPHIISLCAETMYAS